MHTYSQHCTGSHPEIMQASSTTMSVGELGVEIETTRFSTPLQVEIETTSTFMTFLSLGIEFNLILICNLCTNLVHK